MIPRLDVLDDFKIFLPKYLSEGSQSALFDELKNYPSNLNQRFYTNKRKNTLLQGDGLDNVLAPDHVRKSFRKVKGFLVSNSCDVSRENKRLYRPQLSFAPIVDLAKWEKILLESGKNATSVSGHINAIREQKITPFFFLPKTSSLKNDCFVRFDCIFSVPSEFLKEPQEEKIFTLSNYGFYVLLFKLSVHFTRVQESIDRDKENL